MTSEDVSDEQLGQLARRQHDLFRRVREGSIPVEEALATIQALLDVPRMKAKFYRLHVTYAKLLGVKALEPKFSGKHSVSVIYDGRPWERHSSCVTIDQTPGERELLLAEVPKQFIGKRICDCWDDLSAYLGPKGFRFAIETETAEFAKAKPEPQHKKWIYALGSSALSDDGNRCVAMLRADAYGRMLGGYPVANVLHDDSRLLLVHNASSAQP